MNILFATHETHQKWLYDRIDWEQTRKDLNAYEVINYFEKGDRDFPSEYLYKPCSDVSDAEYRLEIMQELFNREDLYKKLSDYVTDLRKFRTFLRDFKEETHEIQKNYRYLLLFCEYAKCTTNLRIILENAESGGLKKVYHYCSLIISDGAFHFGREYADRLVGEISALLKKTGISVNPSEKTFAISECVGSGETELLLNEIAEIYGINMKKNFSIVDPMPLSYLEEQILLMLIEKNPRTFDDLQIFSDKYLNILNDIKVFADFLPQFLFFINYIEFIRLFQSYGLKVCAPEFNNDIYQAEECASISLAVKFYYESLSPNDIVRNDINLPYSGKFILSGPNQGGKTIYLKQLGLTSYLAKCGCFVLCKSCRLPFYDKILTHFMQKEILGKSRLAEEIERIEAHIMPKITRESLVLLNESFTSTRRKDSVKISLHYLKKFDETGCSVGFVSHFYELPELHRNVISLRSGIGEGGARTYHISEQKGDGFAYARDISRICGTTYEQLIKDIKVLT